MGAVTFTVVLRTNSTGAYRRLRQTLKTALRRDQLARDQRQRARRNLCRTPRRHRDHARRKGVIAMKMKDTLLSEEKKQQVTTASPSTVPEVPEDWLAELQRFREAVAYSGRPSVFFGRLFKFKKGDWVFLGGEKEKIPDRSRWIAIMAEARHGWRKFVEVTTEDGDIKRVPEYRVGKISEGYEPLPREDEDLGDLDKAKWKIGLDGKPEDPWKRVAYLPLLSLDGEKVVTFLTDTKTGLPRFYALIDRYAWIGRQHLGQYPIIELRASGYDDKRFAWVHTPDFEIVGWVGRPDPARLLGHAGDGSGGGGGDDGSVEPPPYDIIPGEYEDEQV
jgi:hypothetical protein